MLRVCAILVFAGNFGTAGHVMAQALKDVQTPPAPLVLKAQGSFFVGGEEVEQTEVELGNPGPGGHIAINQMMCDTWSPRAVTATSRL